VNRIVFQRRSCYMHQRKVGKFIGEVLNCCSLGLNMNVECDFIIRVD
jgi:hypothetical protein